MKDTFNFWVPLEDDGGFIEKAAKTEKGDSRRYENMYLAGMASNNAKDSEGEVLEPSGYDLSRFLKSGFINFEHKSKNDPKYLIGEPVAAEVKGDEFHVKGKLYKDSEIARNLWDTVIMMKSSGASRKLGWSIEGRATERSISDPKKITKALITGIALTFNPVNTNSYADICKGEQKEDLVIYEYDTISKSETSKYIYIFESNGKNWGITKSFDVEEIQKDMTTENTAVLVPESLDKKVRVLEPAIKKAILSGLIELKDIDRIEKGKKAAIGEIRTYSGVEYRKVTETGNPNKDWVRVKKTDTPSPTPEAKKEEPKMDFSKMSTESLKEASAILGKNIKTDADRKLFHEMVAESVRRMDSDKTEPAKPVAPAKALDSETMLKNGFKDYRYSSSQPDKYIIYNANYGGKKYYAIIIEASSYGDKHKLDTVLLYETKEKSVKLNGESEVKKVFNQAKQPETKEMKEAKVKFSKVKEAMKGINAHLYLMKDGEINIELGYNYPDEVFNKVMSSLKKNNIPTAGISVSGEIYAHESKFEEWDYSGHGRQKYK